MPSTDKGRIISVIPEDLEFKFELRKTIPVAVQITNVTSKRVAFKVKTTSPKKYCVRPSHGFIEANSVKEVQVILQAQREAPSSYQKCKDKFLIQAAVVDNSVKDVNSELFDSMKSKDLDQVKLRVTMMPPAKPPSPVPEATEGSEAASPTITLGPTDLLTPGAGGDVSSQQTGVQSLSGTSRKLSFQEKQEIVQTGYSLLSVLFIALLAFAIGYYSRGQVPVLEDFQRYVLSAARPVLKLIR